MEQEQGSLVENIRAQRPGDPGGARTSSRSHRLSSVLGVLLAPALALQGTAQPQPQGRTQPWFRGVPTLGCPATVGTAEHPEPRFVPAAAVPCVPEQRQLRGQPQGHCLRVRAPGLSTALCWWALSRGTLRAQPVPGGLSERKYGVNLTEWTPSPTPIRRALPLCCQRHTQLQGSQWSRSPTVHTEHQEKHEKTTWP